LNFESRLVCRRSASLSALQRRFASRLCDF